MNNSNSIDILQIDLRKSIMPYYGKVDNEDVVKFNNILLDNAKNIIFDIDTGIIRINNPGKYLVNWWVSVQRVNIGWIVSLAVKGRFKNQDEYLVYPTTTSTKYSQVMGMAVLDLTAIENIFPFELSLTNISEGPLAYDNDAEIVAGLSIVQLATEIIEKYTGDFPEILQLEVNEECNPIPTTIKYCEPVIFNNTISSFSSIITFNSDSGFFTINKSGRYLVNWWVATQSVLGHYAVEFAIIGKFVNEEFYKVIGSATAIKTGQVVGNAVIDVPYNENNETYEFLLINVTGISKENKEVDWGIKPWQLPTNIDTTTKETYAVLYAEYTKIKANMAIVELAPKGEVGPKGPRGAKGEIGPTGPKGEAGKNAISSGILVKIKEYNDEIKIGEAIPFNSVGINTDKNNITFDYNTKSIFVGLPGIYAIDWWINLDEANTNGPKYIELEMDGQVVVEDDDIIERYGKLYYVTSCNIINSGLVYGQYLISTNGPTKIRLINNSLQPIQLCKYAKMQGSIRVIANYY